MTLEEKDQRAENRCGNQRCKINTLNHSQYVVYVSVEMGLDVLCVYKKALTDNLTAYGVWSS